MATESDPFRGEPRKDKTSVPRETLKATGGSVNDADVEDDDHDHDANPVDLEDDDEGTPQ